MTDYSGLIVFMVMVVVFVIFATLLLRGHFDAFILRNNKILSEVFY